ncbi:MAG: hypothetical protein MK083_00045 [Dehalococcoidia bacterium]|nr:hypothetical protein [Dehalococcoidia bacterium]
MFSTDIAPEEDIAFDRFSKAKVLFSMVDKAKVLFSMVDSNLANLSFIYFNLSFVEAIGSFEEFAESDSESSFSRIDSACEHETISIKVKISIFFIH